MASQVIVSNTAGDVTCTIDGIKYDFKIQSYDNVAGYAPVGIKDNSTGIYYQSYGYLELNGHIFVTKWKQEYDDSRENYIRSKELIVEVD